jgi:hypothetical protein
MNFEKIPLTILGPFFKKLAKWRITFGKKKKKKQVT